ncbi:SagB family peptide dehydrogenase [Streptomyces sp. NPDC001852]|uniref:SagB family peptide dehydrogenase n=1 Tax=Streptomyces sp. NPDC001852 TaxID=3364619 RepID=UPI00367413CE
MTAETTAETTPAQTTPAQTAAARTDAQTAAARSDAQTAAARSDAQTAAARTDAQTAAARSDAQAAVVRTGMQTAVAQMTAAGTSAQIPAALTAAQATAPWADAQTTAGTGAPTTAGRAGAETEVAQMTGAHAGAELTAAPTVAARVVRRVRLRRDAGCEAAPAGARTVRLVAPTGSLNLPDLSAGAREAVAALAFGEHTEDELGALVAARDGETGLLRWQLAFRRLGMAGMLETSVHLVTEAADEPLARLRPIGRGAALPGPVPDPTRQVKLSRFATAAAEDGALLVRAPGSALAVELGTGAAGLLPALAGWTSPAALAQLPGGLTLDAVRQILRLFDVAGLLAYGSAGQEPETGERRFAQWSALDLMFHSRTRRPSTVAGYGGTYRFGDRFAPEPASPPPFPGEKVAPAVPDLAALARTDKPLTEVLEQRRSVRDHDEESPLTVDQLGELLYRTMRRRQTFTGGDRQEHADRPYPSGGAVHELEVYPLVTQCTGLRPGLWHYATDRHELELVAEPGPATAALVTGARESALMTTDPQVVLLVTARFGRVMWKYETVAYPLILKHVGVLYQTLYLVGTAMDLAVCGLGGGDAADFATASGLDFLTEGTVGELVVGSRPMTLRQDVGVPRREPKR